MKAVFPGVFDLNGSFATISADPGRQVYKERIVKREGKEYRVWDAFRSKLCGAMKKGLKNFLLDNYHKVL